MARTRSIRWAICFARASIDSRSIKYRAWLVKWIVENDLIFSRSISRISRPYGVREMKLKRVFTPVERASNQLTPSCTFGWKCVTSFRLASMTSPMRRIGLFIGPSRSIIRLPVDAGVCLSLSLSLCDSRIQRNKIRRYDETSARGNHRDFCSIGELIWSPPVEIPWSFDRNRSCPIVQWWQNTLPWKARSFL